MLQRYGGFALSVLQIVRSLLSVVLSAAVFSRDNDHAMSVRQRCSPAPVFFLSPSGVVNLSLPSSLFKKKRETCSSLSCSVVTPPAAAHCPSVTLTPPSSPPPLPPTSVPLIRPHTHTRATTTTSIGSSSARSLPPFLLHLAPRTHVLCDRADSGARWHRNCISRALRARCDSRCGRVRQRQSLRARRFQRQQLRLRRQQRGSTLR